jgi:hypothetical protein
MEGALQAFVLVVGNSRSGTSMVGSILDSHPNMLCAHETKASRAFWDGWTREAIVAEIEENSAAALTHDRYSEGYRYAIPSAPKGEITLLADKIWNPALLLLAGDVGLLRGLSETMNAPVKLVHCVRNPFDVIATMSRRSGASLDDRARWFFMHCDAAEALMARGEAPIHLVRNEDLTAGAETVTQRLFAWLGYRAEPAHLAQVRGVVKAAPNRSRDSVTWPQELIGEIEARAGRYTFLDGYRFDN